jgi:hypothetical protein
MKYTLFLFLSLFLSLQVSAAGLDVSADVTTEVGRGLTSKPIINFTNNGTTPVTVNWNIDMAASVIPTGYTVVSVCELPGNCYMVNGGTHSLVVNPGQTVGLEPTINITDTARLDSACKIVINTDANGGKAITYTVQAKNWSTAIANANKISLDLYPQPAVNKLNVVHNNTSVTKAIVYNLIGKKIEEFVTPANSNGFNIPVNALTDGMYILEIRDYQNKVIATQRFSKQ